MSLVPSKPLADLKPLETRAALKVYCAPLKNLIPLMNPSYEITGFKVTGSLPEGARVTCLEKAKQALLPASKEQIKQAMIYCGANTASKGDVVSSDPDEMKRQKDARKLRNAAMFEEFSKYPGDLVVNALRTWHENNKWFPDTGDIVRAIKQETEARKSLVAALSTPKEKAQEETNRKWADLTDEEKAKHEQNSKRILDMCKAAGQQMKVS